MRRWSRKGTSGAGDGVWEGAVFCVCEVTQASSRSRRDSRSTVEGSGAPGSLLACAGGAASCWQATPREVQLEHGKARLQRSLRFLHRAHETGRCRGCRGWRPISDSAVKARRLSCRSLVPPRGWLSCCKSTVETMDQTEFPGGYPADTPRSATELRGRDQWRRRPSRICGAARPGFRLDRSRAASPGPWNHAPVLLRPDSGLACRRSPLSIQSHPCFRPILCRLLGNGRDAPRKLLLVHPRAPRVDGLIGDGQAS